MIASSVVPLKGNDSRSTKKCPNNATVDRRLGVAAKAVKAFTMLCEHNSDVRRLDDVPSNLKYYHATEAPSWSLAAYVERLARHGDTGPEGILIGLRLAGRCHAHSKTTLTRLSAHRVMICGITLGVKAVVDRFRTNRTMARAGAMSLKELNVLEIEFYKDIDHRAVVTQRDVDHLLDKADLCLKLFAMGHTTHAIAAAESAICGEPGDDPLAAFPDGDAIERTLATFSAESSPDALQTDDSSGDYAAPLQREDSEALMTNNSFAITIARPASPPVVGPTVKVVRQRRARSPRVQDIAVVDSSAESTPEATTLQPRRTFAGRLRATISNDRLARELEECDNAFLAAHG